MPNIMGSFGVVGGKLDKVDKIFWDYGLLVALRIQKLRFGISLIWLFH